MRWCSVMCWLVLLYWCMVWWLLGYLVLILLVVFSVGNYVYEYVEYLVWCVLFNFELDSIVNYIEYELYYCW